MVKSDILELLNNTFVFNTCNGHFYQNLRINYEFLDAFVVKSDILELLKKKFGFASKFHLEDNPTFVISQKELMN